MRRRQREELRGTAILERPLCVTVRPRFAEQRGDHADETERSTCKHTAEVCGLIAASFQL